MAGKKFDQLDKNKMHSVFTFVFLLELGISICCLLTSVAFAGASKNVLVFVLVSVYLFFFNIESFFSSILLATKSFTFESITFVGKSLFSIVYILIFYFLNKRAIYYPSFYIFCILNISVSLCADIAYAIRCRGFLFCKSESKVDFFNDLKKYFSFGIPLALASLTTELLMMVDKQFISIFYPVSESNIFSIYSFAYSMLSLITAATAAVSTVLFPYMRGQTEEKLISAYPNLNIVFDIFLSLAGFSFYFLQWFIGAYLPKYNDSIPVFQILLPGLMINSPIVVIMHSYYKAFNQEKNFLYQNLLILALSILADALSYYCYVSPYSKQNPILISISSVFVIIIWYFISQFYLSKKYHLVHWKNDFYLFGSTIGFFLLSYFLSPLWGSLAYLALLSLTIAVFYHKEIKYGIIKIKDKKRKK